MESALDPKSNFRQSLSKMDELVRSGASFSGHERNCVFLNTGGDRLANVSAVSGLDFLDDARSHALVDWDGDGDLDLWSANRTAPQLRFLRNDVPSTNDFVAFRLQGRTCNRDGIGARVEVVLEDQHELKLLKALRAGEGFLGQSSKWLYFGLGKNATIKKVFVHWPGQDTPQVFNDVKPNQLYLVTQNQQHLQIVQTRRRANLKQLVIETGNRTSAERVSLSSRIPLPNLEYRTFTDETVSLNQWYGSPLLINLWATWCAPCVTELELLAREHGKLQDVGLKFISLSIDGVGSATDSDLGRPEELLLKIGFPYDSGFATEKLLDILQYLCDVRFSQHRKLPLPCSLLVDRQARVAVIYRGIVNVDEVVKDVDKVLLSDEDWSLAALPFSGRWNRVPNGPNELVVPLYLIRQGYVNETLSIVSRFDKLYSSNREYPRLLVWLGDELYKQDKIAEGLRQYERALSHDPNYVPAMNNLAWKLASHPDSTIRDGAKALEWARRAAEATNHKNAAVLDTLAAALAETGEFSDAVETAEAALRIARQQQQVELIRTIEVNLQKYKQSIPPFRDVR